jgi:hypothetical protein
MCDLWSVHFNDEVADFETFGIKREHQRLYDRHPSYEAAA